MALLILCRNIYKYTSINSFIPIDLILLIHHHNWEILAKILIFRDEESVVLSYWTQSRIAYERSFIEFFIIYERTNERINNEVLRVEK